MTIYVIDRCLTHGIEEFEIECLQESMATDGSMEVCREDGYHWIPKEHWVKKLVNAQRFARAIRAAEIARLNALDFGKDDA